MVKRRLIKALAMLLTFCMVMSLNVAAFAANSFSIDKTAANFPVPSVEYTVEPEENSAFGSLQLQKIDKVSKEALAGVEFTLYDAQDEKLDAYETDENGRLTIVELLPGRYVLEETKAPAGYDLPEEPIRFTVDDDGIVTIEECGYAGFGDAADAKENVLTESKELTAEQLAELGIEKISAPEVTVALTPGDSSAMTENAEIKKIVTEGETFYDYTELSVIAQREVTAEASEVVNTYKFNKSDEQLTGIMPALKFDRTSTADQNAQKKARELYTDNGHFHDPDTFTVTDAPEGYPWKYVGHGDYSGHYISHVKVVYARDDAGNALKDENGDYIIKELQHASSGTPLHYGGELTTNIEGPFHYATGTRPQQFLLKNENGDIMYGYCIDLATGAESNSWYRLANLEDNDYYASEEAENHIRNIVLNGYWGSAEGEGSLASLKEALKAAAAANEVDVEQNVKMVNRKNFTTGYELMEGEYRYGNYVYWDIDAVDVKLTNEIIDQMTEGEALDAMQAAIWSWANGSNATLNGVDRAIIGDMYAASSKMSDSLNGKNDPEGAARTKALYQYLMSLDEPLESTVIINEKTFAKDMQLKIGEKLADNTYAAELMFTIDGERAEGDELKVELTYKDANGIKQTLVTELTGENAAVADENGYYTISDLELAAGVPFEYSLRIIGKQQLQMGAYIFTSEDGTTASQTFVTAAKGMCSVDVTKSMSITFTVEESLKGIYTRRKVLVVENSRTSSNVEWKSGQASNISFMLIDKETGKVEFLYKNDIDSETSAEIPAKEGMISAVFIKQSTSGMFWFSEKVDNSTIGATIECLKANNPSYTGYNAIAYGAGEHDLEFKSGKWATYTFNAGVEVDGDDGYLEYNEPAEDTSAGDKNNNKKK